MSTLVKRFKTLVRSSSSVAAIDHLAQELCRRAKVATVYRARAAAHTLFTALDVRVRAELHRHGGCARWGHDFRKGGDDSDHWISKRSSDGHGRDIVARCMQCRLWYWMSEDGWQLDGIGASRTCKTCGKECPAARGRCPRCGTKEAPAAEVDDA